MSDGIYVAMSGAVGRVRQLEMVANNLANLETTAYRRRQVMFSEYLGRRTAPPAGQSPDAALVGERTVPVDLVHVSTAGDAESARPGRLFETDAELDMALEGDGFFVLQTSAGERFTRDGHFVRGPSGVLAATDGALVMGEKGPIRLPDGPVAVRGDGTVLVGEQERGRLRLVDFPTPDSLLREGANRYRSAAAPRAARAVVRQGRLESANVNPLKEMVALIEAHRGFETLQQAIQSYREMDNRANDIGRPI